MFSHSKSKTQTPSLNRVTAQVAHMAGVILSLPPTHLRPPPPYPQLTLPWEQPLGRASTSSAVQTPAAGPAIQKAN